MVEMVGLPREEVSPHVLESVRSEVCCGESDTGHAVANKSAYARIVRHQTGKACHLRLADGESEGLLVTVEEPHKYVGCPKRLRTNVVVDIGKNLHTLCYAKELRFP
ncbi:hypothetical protein [Blastococcus sp. CT_GayMR16]|uniref:hypothetical protein n=1 Tax=Blastococcus sp. CT_GayMR16 TaxID=2559607 RepID=UPI001FD7DD9F|nr:hypothetical protein [Blastococcus sp. CT_GayMR16]